ncbi:MAG TPA: hypothetical protein VFU49_01160 [Ktedonobacteraceae bacterium]|nr:hypothetical protein [Ktedonobacteraceae bacterium]
MPGRSGLVGARGGALGGWGLALALLACPLFVVDLQNTCRVRIISHRTDDEKFVVRVFPRRRASARPPPPSTPPLAPTNAAIRPTIAIPV